MNHWQTNRWTDSLTKSMTMKIYLYTEPRIMVKLHSFQWVLSFLIMAGKFRGPFLCHSFCKREQQGSTNLKQIWNTETYPLDLFMHGKPTFLCEQGTWPDLTVSVKALSWESATFRMDPWGSQQRLITCLPVRLLHEPVCSKAEPQPSNTDLL